MRKQQCHVGQELRGSVDRSRVTKVAYCLLLFPYIPRVYATVEIHGKGPQLPFLKRQHALNGINFGEFAYGHTCPGTQGLLDFC